MKKQLLILLLVCVSGLCGMFRGSSVLAAAARRTASDGAMSIPSETDPRKLFKDLAGKNDAELEAMIAAAPPKVVEACLVEYDTQGRQAFMSCVRNHSTARALQKEADKIRALVARDATEKK